MGGFAYADAIALRPDGNPERVAESVAESRRRVPGSVVFSIKTDVPPPPGLVSAAAAAIGSSGDVLLYVLGDATHFEPELLTPFRRIHHLNLNTHRLRNHEFLSVFEDLRTLTIQGHSSRPVDLQFLGQMPELVRLSLRGTARRAEALATCHRLEFLAIPSDRALLQATVGNEALRYLDISFGNDTDLSPLAKIDSLRGVGIYQVRGLTGDHLAPLAECAMLTALSLGALRNVTDLRALHGSPSTTLRALLLERVPNLPDLTDVGACAALTQLGLYESRPKNKQLSPLRRLGDLTHLVLGDMYPQAEIDALIDWYTGSLHYRNQFERGEFKPRWRTSIDQFDS